MVRRSVVLLLFLMVLIFGGITVTWFAPSLLAQDSPYRIFLPYVNVLDDGDNDGTFFSHYEPVFVIDIQNRVYVDRTPPADRTVIYAGGTGDLARYIANWQVGDYTGYFPAKPKRNTQRGAPDGGYGSTAVQLEGFVAAMHLNGSAGSSAEGSQFAQLHYSFQSPPLPWSRGINPRFCLDNDASIPHSSLTDNAINYAYTLVSLVDTTTNRRLWLLMSLYDTREDVIRRGDILGWWAEASEPIVYGYYGSNDFTSPMVDSARSTSGNWSDWRYFGYCMSSEQLLAMIREANQEFGVGMSENVAVYGVASFGVGPEIFNPDAADVSVSMRVKDIRLFTLADPQ